MPEISIRDSRMAEPRLKMIGLLDRRPDLTLDDFAWHWRTIHRDLALRLVVPGYMLGYVQNHRLAEGGAIEGLPVAGDGFPELWTEGADILQRLGGAPEYLEGAALDEPNFMDGRSRVLLALEHVVDEALGRLEAASRVKAMLFFRRASRVSPEAFAAAFLAPSHPWLLPTSPRPLRLTRHVAIRLPAEAGDAYAGTQVFDGVESSWWPDAASFRRAWAERAAAPAAIDAAATEGVLVREEPVLFAAPVRPKFH